jgi:DNA-binding protein Fis
VLEHFQTKSIQVQNIIKGFNLTKSLFVSSVLIGEEYTGKKTLVKYLFPDAIYADGSDQTNVKDLLENHNELIIINFEKLTNIENLNFENKRIVALANYISNEKTIDSIFAFIYHMPPLRERPEDIDLFIEYFSKETKRDLMIEGDLFIDKKFIDISTNIQSLKKSIYYQAFSQNCSHSDIENILYQYLYSRMKGNNDYKEFLPIYERPLIEAGLDKYNSQLKLSKILGINRNTLRKKMHELGIN